MVVPKDAKDINLNLNRDAHSSFSLHSEVVQPNKQVSLDSLLMKKLIILKFLLSFRNSFSHYDHSGGLNPPGGSIICSYYISA